jgi:predicted O-linked N-acetylglucosamine transferase (SPINDLY family)
LPTIDYYLSAEGLEPENAQDNYTERLVALPQLGCSYQRLSVAPATVDLDALGIRADRPLLLCPGAPFKYASRHDGTFVRIARELGRCQFIFVTHDQEALSTTLRLRLEAGFAGAGLDFHEYGVFIPWQPRAAFYGLMRRADVYLDTIDFSGFNTAMQAVECGLPIVTIDGNFLRGRLASGVLKRMGLAELVVASEDDYVALAVRLARDAPYRERLRERIAAARDILFDSVEPVRALEAFLSATIRRP